MMAQHLWGGKPECKRSNAEGPGRKQNTYGRFPADDGSTNDEQSNSRQNIPRRQKTLSMAKPVLEEALNRIREIEKRLEMSSNGHCSVDPDVTMRKGVYTEPKEVNGDAEADKDLSNLFSKNLQIGNGNFMVFCENMETGSEQKPLQIGNQNVIVNISSQCNKCQILDHLDQVVPLDSNGEVWLEIKRRSLNGKYNNKSQTNSPGAHNGMNDLSGSTRYIECGRVPSKTAKLSAAQHSVPPPPSSSGAGPSRREPVENDEEDNDPLYDKIIFVQGGRLSKKVQIPTEHEDSTDFAKRNMKEFLEDDSVKEYMSEGGDFELSVCTWTYEKEDVYSTKHTPKPTDIYSLPTPPPQKDAVPSYHAPPLPVAWLKETMDIKQAHAYLRGKKDGAFLVRKATHFDHNHKYTIEFIDKGKIRRLRILSNEYGFYFEYSENKAFSSLKSLITAIQTAGLEIKEEKTDQWKTVKVFPV